MRASQVNAAVGALTALRVKSFSSCFSQLNKFPSLLARPTWATTEAIRREAKARVKSSVKRRVQSAGKLTNNGKQSTVARTKSSSNKVSTVFTHWLTSSLPPSPLSLSATSQSKYLARATLKALQKLQLKLCVCVVWRGGRQGGAGGGRAGVWLCNENFEKQITCKLSFSIQLSGDRWQSSLHTFVVEARGKWGKCGKWQNAIKNAIEYQSKWLIMAKKGPESRLCPRSGVTIKVFATALHNETKDPNESQVASLSWPLIVLLLL